MLICELVAFVEYHSDDEGAASSVQQKWAKYDSETEQERKFWSLTEQSQNRADAGEYDGSAAIIAGRGSGGMMSSMLIESLAHARAKRFDLALALPTTEPGS